MEEYQENLNYQGSGRLFTMYFKGGGFKPFKPFKPKKSPTPRTFRIGGKPDSGFKPKPDFKPFSGSKNTAYVPVSHGKNFNIGVTHHNNGLGKLKIFDKSQKKIYGVPIKHIHTKRLLLTLMEITYPTFLFGMNLQIVVGQEWCHLEQLLIVCIDGLL